MAIMLFPINPTRLNTAEIAWISCFVVLTSSVRLHVHYFLAGSAIICLQIGDRFSPVDWYIVLARCIRETSEGDGVTVQNSTMLSMSATSYNKIQGNALRRVIRTSMISNSDPGRILTANTPPVFKARAACMTNSAESGELAVPCLVHKSETRMSKLA